MGTAKNDSSPAKTLWLITARSGSKGIPNKNIRLLGNFPLLSYRIRAALSFANPEDVWISTDSEEYATIAKKAGASAPFIRPVELAQDKSSTNDVVLHAMDWAEKSGKKYAAIAVLEPTSPFICASHLKEASEKLLSTSLAEAIVAVREAKPCAYDIQEDSEFLVTLAKRIKEQKLTRRQDHGREITPSGGFYISKWEEFRKNKSFYSERTLAYTVPEICGLEIDSTLDWLWAEFIIGRKLITVDEIASIKPLEENLINKRILEIS